MECNLGLYLLRLVLGAYFRSYLNLRPTATRLKVGIVRAGLGLTKFAIIDDEKREPLPNAKEGGTLTGLQG